MTSSRTKHKIWFLLIAWAVAGVLMIQIARSGNGGNTNKPAEFSRTTIDVGVVVGNIDKAAQFYGQVLGFPEEAGFDVPAQMAGDTGLTDGKPFKVRVFTLGSEPAATRLKVMEIPDAGAKPVDNQYISSSLGIRYLTVFVADLTRSIERLKQHQIAPVKAPYHLSNSSNYLIVVKDPDGNNIELIGPMR